MRRRVQSRAVDTTCEEAAGKLAALDALAVVTGGFEFAKRVAHFGGLLVVFALHRFSEIDLELLPFAQWPFVVDLFEPILKRLDFSTLLGPFRT